MDSPSYLPEYMAASQTPTPGQPPRSRLPMLLGLLLVVVIIALLPTLVERIEYSRTRGEVQALREQLPELNLKTLSKAFTLVYREVKPSVVHINTQRTVGAGGGGDFLAMFSGRGPAYEAQGQASGVIVDEAGYIITNLHAVENSKVEVKLDDGRTFEAEEIGTDPKIDLAVLKINADGLTAAKWGDSDKLEVGEMVWAIGNPFGLDQTITAGIVSAKNRPGQSVYQEFLQTDVAINPGNSGGPLVDINGDVLGINTAIVGRGYQGISFAIPSNLAHESYDRIRKDGKVTRAYLGVELDTPNRRDIQRLKLPLDRPLGAIVRSVTPNTPAHAAGIQKHDLIVEWNGIVVTSDRELTLMIARTPLDEKVRFKVLRDNKELELEATVAEKPSTLR